MWKPEITRPAKAVSICGEFWAAYRNFGNGRGRVAGLPDIWNGLPVSMVDHERRPRPEGWPRAGRLRRACPTSSPVAITWLSSVVLVLYSPVFFPGRMAGSRRPGGVLAVIHSFSTAPPITVRVLRHDPRCGHGSSIDHRLETHNLERGWVSGKRLPLQ